MEVESRNAVSCWELDSLNCDDMRVWSLTGGPHLLGQTKNRVETICALEIVKDVL